MNLFNRFVKDFDTVAHSDEAVIEVCNKIATAYPEIVLPDNSLSMSVEGYVSFINGELTKISKHAIKEELSPIRYKVDITEERQFITDLIVGRPDWNGTAGLDLGYYLKLRPVPGYLDIEVNFYDSDKQIHTNLVKAQRILGDYLIEYTLDKLPYDLSVCSSDYFTTTDK